MTWWRFYSQKEGGAVEEDIQHPIEPGGQCGAVARVSCVVEYSERWTSVKGNGFSHV